MINIFIVLALAALLAWAVYHTVQKSRKGGGCCGEHETVKRISVSDRNKSHYPYQVELQISGMTCENCARRVENALNGIDGVWAKVDLGSRRARVLMKTEPDEKRIRETVSAAGYAVAECRLK